MVVIAAEFDNVRLRRALRKQEQSRKQDGKCLDASGYRVRTCQACYFIAGATHLQA